MKKGKYTLEIMQDSDPLSPREWDNLGTFIMQHGRYSFGDIDFETDPYSNKSFYDDFKYHLKEVEDCTIKDVIYLPVYMYDHSGITIKAGESFSCSWDSGQIGYIYITKKQVYKEYGWKRITKEREKQIEEYLVNEIKVLDDYLNGNVFGFNLTNDETDEDVESCWGFYGDTYAEDILPYVEQYGFTLEDVENTEIEY